MLQFANDVQYAVVEQLKWKWEGEVAVCNQQSSPSCTGSSSSVVVHNVEVEVQ